MKSRVWFMDKKWFRFPLLAGLLALSAGSLLGCLKESSSGPEADVPLDAPLPGLGSTAFLTHPGDSLDESQLPSQSEVADELETMGYSKYEFQDKSVLVDGDMLMHRADFLAPASGENPALAKTAQRFYGGKAVNRGQVWRVKMALPTNWQAGARMAMGFWAGEAKIRLREVQWNEAADITISMKSLAQGIYALSGFPFEAFQVVRPGLFINVNLKYWSTTTANSKWIMIHEFGHSFGFEHTDNLKATWIFPTPPLDSRSFLNSVIDFNKISYSAGDRMAIHAKYP
jgi:hypothetical protein